MARLFDRDNFENVLSAFGDKPAMPDSYPALFAQAAAPQTTSIQLQAAFLPERGL